MDNKYARENTGGQITLLYIFVYFIVSAIFLLELYSSIAGRFFENDLWWMVPSFYHYTENKSMGEIIKFIFGAEPYMLGAPVVKSYLYLVLKFFKPEAKYFIYGLLVFHFLNSVLLFLLGQKLKLGLRISFLASLMYLALYAHFESYMWPFNMQHLSVTFFILLILNLYLKTDGLINNGERHRSYWALTILANFAASFSRMTIVILPAIVFSHILLCSRDNAERVKKYDTWLPLFITYLIYPLMVLTSVGDDQAEVFLRIKSIPFVLNWLIFFAGGLLCLLAVRVAVKNYTGFLPKRPGRLISLLLLILWAVAAIKDIRNLILPYNIMVPFSAALNSFLTPIQSVLLLDSAQVSYQVHSQMGSFGFLLGLVFIAVFVKKFVSVNRQLAVLFIWYLIPLGYLNLYSNILSRYMVYISPVMCIIISSVISALFDYVFEKVKLKSLTKEIIITGIFIALLIPNILAIKLELFRQKMACSFYLYDYIRTANIIGNNIAAHSKNNEYKDKNIYISGAKSMPFKDLWEFSPVDPENFYNFKFVISQEIKDIPPDNFKINPAAGDAGDGIHYIIQNGKVVNSTGEDLDPFNKLFYEGVKEFRSRDYKLSEPLFYKAAIERPFFLNFILSGYPVEDSVWLTDGKDISSWINRTFDQAGLTPQEEEKPEKAMYIKSMIEDEISAYIQSLFYLSYINYAKGDRSSSEYWFSKIPYLISDPGKVRLMLSRVPEIKSDDDAMSFLNKFTEAASYIPILWNKPVRDRLPTNFQLFTVKFMFDGKVNELIDNKAARYMKTHRKEREKPHSMPGAL